MWYDYDQLNLCQEILIVHNDNCLEKMYKSDSDVSKVRWELIYQEIVIKKICIKIKNLNVDFLKLSDFAKQ